MKTASWVVREKATGRVIGEFFNPEVVAVLNAGRYEAVPILQYLQEFNAKVKAAAPDLLAACKAALEHEQDSVVTTLLENAIAKAEGRQP